MDDSSPCHCHCLLPVRGNMSPQLRVSLPAVWTWRRHSQSQRRDSLCCWDWLLPNPERSEGGLGDGNYCNSNELNPLLKLIFSSARSKPICVLNRGFSNAGLRRTPTYNRDVDDFSKRALIGSVVNHQTFKRSLDEFLRPPKDNKSVFCTENERLLSNKGAT